MWTLKSGIKTPKGMYTPEGNNLLDEITNAARFAGLNSFNVKVNGAYVDTVEDLTHTDFAGVTSVEIEPYDVAG